MLTLFFSSFFPPIFKKTLQVTNHSSLPALGKRDRSWSSNLGEQTPSQNGQDKRWASMNGRRRPPAASVGTLSRADADELAKLVGDVGQNVIDQETKGEGGEQQEEGIVFGV